MTTIEELRQLRRLSNKRDHAANSIRAQVQDSSDLPAGQLRVYRPNERQTVIINAARYRVGMWLYLRYNAAGELYVDAVNISDAIETFGDAIDTATMPTQIVGEATGAVYGDINLRPGMTRPTNAADGLEIYIEPFWGANGTRYGNVTVDVTASVPSTTDTARWVIPYINELDGTTGLANGNEQYTGLDALWGDRDTLIQQISVPLGAYPCRAFTLEEGQTAVSYATSKFADAPRAWLSSRHPLNKYAASAAPTVNDDSGDGYSVGSLWTRTNGDMYRCADTTLGAAVWTQIGSGTGYLTVEDEGTPVTQRDTINFTGAGVSVADSGGKTVVTISSGSSAPDYILIQDQKSSGTDGGTFTSGAWQTRTLNTEVTDSGGHASLSSNQITLAAGTYECLIRVPSVACGRHQAILYNTSNSSETLTGSSAYNADTSLQQGDSVIQGRFTIAATKTFEVRHRCETTRSTNGFGIATGTSFTVTTEVYTSAAFWKVA